jgi:hypothetical protein
MELRTSGKCSLQLMSPSLEAVHFSSVTTDVATPHYVSWNHLSLWKNGDKIIS